VRGKHAPQGQESGDMLWGGLLGQVRLSSSSCDLASLSVLRVMNRQVLPFNVLGFSDFT